MQAYVKGGVRLGARVRADRAWGAPSRAAARLAVVDFIEAFCQPKRCHLALGYLGPVAFERATQQEAA